MSHILNPGRTQKNWLNGSYGSYPIDLEVAPKDDELLTWSLRLYYYVFRLTLTADRTFHLLTKSSSKQTAKKNGHMRFVLISDGISER